MEDNVDEFLKRNADKIHNYNRRQELMRMELLAQHPTLRDQFAMTALGGLLSNPIFSTVGVAKRSFEIADAMLKERESEKETL